MLRVRIELVPDGINELTQELERVTIGCKFPLDAEKQDLYIFGEPGRRYAEITANIDELLYNPPGGRVRALELVYSAIGALLTQNTVRNGGETFPGMMAIPPAEFDQVIAAMVELCPDIQSIRLFGRRVEDIPLANSYDTALAVFAVENRNNLNGDDLLKNYPGYIPYHLAIKLDPLAYRGKLGELWEWRLTSEYSLRDHPHIPDMRCFNGLLFYFLRPDGGVVCPLGIDGKVTKRQAGLVTYGSDTVYDLSALKDDIKRGHLIYNKKQGLQPYPGVRW